MTREERVDWLCRLRADLNNGIILTPWNKEFTEVLNDVLEQEPCGDTVSRQAVIDAMFGLCDDGENPHIDAITDTIERIPSVTPQPCEDAISRQAVLDALDSGKYSNEFCEEHHIDWSINLGMAHIVVNELMPITPQPKIGHWEWVQYDYNPELGNWCCSECKSVVVECVPAGCGVPLYKHCPQCGSYNGGTEKCQ